MAYHGRSFMATNVTAHSAWRPLATRVAGIHHTLAPYAYRCPFKQPCDESCAEAFAREVFGGRQLPWEQSLLTNLGLDTARRDDWWRAVHHGPVDLQLLGEDVVADAVALIAEQGQQLSGFDLLGLVEDRSGGCLLRCCERGCAVCAVCLSAIGGSRGRTVVPVVVARGWVPVAVVHEVVKPRRRRGRGCACVHR
jgi:hypothetical protein